MQRWLCLLAIAGAIYLAAYALIADALDASVAFAALGITLALFFASFVP